MFSVRMIVTEDDPSCL